MPTVPGVRLLPRLNAASDQAAVSGWLKHLFPGCFLSNKDCDHWRIRLCRCLCVHLRGMCAEALWVPPSPRASSWFRKDPPCDRSASCTRSSTAERTVARLGSCCTAERDEKKGRRRHNTVSLTCVCAFGNVTVKKVSRESGCAIRC